ncbi:MAG TPA: glycosyltransferase family 39 protein, partial [Acidimicrobiales bacterium]|nr:glycosyltransferase family 39 protein [Acidimicrobiales bacterium]
QWGVGRGGRWIRPLALWRSPPGQPSWARPALLAIAGLAGFTYLWGIDNVALEPFYGAAVRSMGSSWKDFFFGALDPAGTISLDKLPGAFWVQALFVRVLGFHVWVVALPQVVAGVLTILVLYRTVCRVLGPKAGIVASAIVAASPVSALLNRGNVSDPLLVLLTVLAADAALRATTSGRRTSLMLAAVWVGLAFQTKMVQAWLVLPALFGVYLFASPSSLRRRMADTSLALVVVVVISLSWMTVVTLVPAHDRPFVDGTTDDSVYAQVFVYNGWSRVGLPLAAGTAVHGTEAFVRAIAASHSQVGTFRIGASPQRLLVGPLGRDDAWLLPAALVSMVGVLWRRRSEPRTDPVRALTVLWGGWLVILGVFFSVGAFVNSYYTAALIPAVAVLCAGGWVAAAKVWPGTARLRSLLAVLVVGSGLYAVALLPAGAGLRSWLVPVIAAVAVVAGAAVLFGSALRSRWRVGRAPLVVAVVSLLVAPLVATVDVVYDDLGSFSTPYQSAIATAGTTTALQRFQADAAAVGRAYVRDVPAGGIVMAMDTSALASGFIMVTGREFLPIGGFSGRAPSPTLGTLQALVHSGRLHTFLLPVRPAGDDPRLRWIRAHCLSGVVYPYTGGVELGYFEC